MGKKTAAHRNRPLAPGTNPNAQQFIPASAKPAKPSTTPLNPAAPEYVPLKVEEPQKLTLAQVVTKNTNGHAPTMPEVKVSPPTGHLKTDDVSVSDKTDSDGHLTDGGSSMSMGSDLGRTSARSSMTKSQQRRQKRNAGKAKSLDLPDGENDREGVANSEGFSVNGGEKTPTKKNGRPPLSPNMTKSPTAERVEVDFEEDATFTMVMPSSKKNSTKANGGGKGRGDGVQPTEPTELNKLNEVNEVNELRRKLKEAEMAVVERDSMKKKLADFEMKWKIHADTLVTVAALQKKVGETEAQLKTYSTQLAQAKEKEAKLLTESKNFQRLMEEKEGQLKKVKEEGEEKGREYEKRLKGAVTETEELKVKLVQAEKDLKESAPIAADDLAFLYRRIHELENTPTKKEMEEMREELLMKAKREEGVVKEREELRERRRVLEEEVDGLRGRVRELGGVKEYCVQLEVQLGEAAGRLGEMEKLRGIVVASEAEIKAQKAEYLTLLTAHQQQDKILQNFQALSVPDEKSDGAVVHKVSEKSFTTSATMEMSGGGRSPLLAGEQQSVLNGHSGKGGSREVSPFRSVGTVLNGENRVAGSIFGSLSSSPQAKHEESNDVGGKETRYLSLAHVVKVDAHPDVLTEHVQRSAGAEAGGRAGAEAGEGDGELDSFGMPVFKGRGASQERAVRGGKEKSPVLEGGDGGEGSPVGDTISSAVPLIEPGTDATVAVQNGGDVEGNGKVTHGPSSAEEVVVPPRRKRRGCCTVQ